MTKRTFPRAYPVSQDPVKLDLFSGSRFTKHGKWATRADGFGLLGRYDVPTLADYHRRLHHQDRFGSCVGANVKLVFSRNGDVLAHVALTRGKASDGQRWRG
jgi:hypothetical protein